MATLRRGLVDKVKKAAAKVSTRGVQVAAKAGTRGARVLVETTVAAVKTVDKLQEKLGRRSAKAPVAEKPLAESEASKAEMPTTSPKASGAAAQKSSGVTASKPAGVTAQKPSRVTASKPSGATVRKTSGATARAPRSESKSRRTAAESEAAPVMLREAGRKTMPTAAPKRSKAAAGPGFKVKRGQKHRHTGR